MPPTVFLTLVDVFPDRGFCACLQGPAGQECSVSTLHCQAGRCPDKATLPQEQHGGELSPGPTLADEKAGLHTPSLRLRRGRVGKSLAHHLPPAVQSQEMKSE